MCQREGVCEVRVNRTRDVWNDNRRGDFAKNEGGSGRWGTFLNRSCGLLLLILLFIFTSTCTPKGSSAASSLRILVPLILLLLSRLLLLLLKGWGGTRLLNGAYLFSSLRLLEGTVVLVLVWTTLFPSKDSVRADLGGHLKYSRRWSGVRAGVLLGAQGAVHRGENRGDL